MASTFKPWEPGTGEYGTHYRFDAAGDGIAMHAHVAPAMRHSTRCLKGSVELYGDVPTQIIKAGDTAVFKSYRMHEIVALENETEIINVLNLGKPKDYDNVPVEHLSGCIDSVLMGKHLFKEGD